MNENNTLNWLKESFSYVDSVTIIDHNGTIIAKQRFNPRYTDEENIIDNQWALGKNLLEVFPGQNPQSSALLAALKRDGVIYREREEAWNHQGKKSVTNNLTFPIICRGQFVGSVQLSRDITNMGGNGAALREEKPEAIPPAGARFTLDDMIGVSREMEDIRLLIQRIANSNSSVLVCGETGTGKELVVSSIHNTSYRREKNFMPINCAALPETILEGLLFGTRKGAFTGAENRKGLFEECNGGTIYLDEINSMPIKLQSKLLRVLDQKVVLPLGESKPRAVDVRIIASVNRPTEQLLEEKELLPDLFYRLNAINIHVPPLRNRLADIEILARHFLDKYNALLGRQVTGISPQAMTLLRGYRWPGNVRELEHCIESAVNLANDAADLTVENLPSYFTSLELPVQHETMPPPAIPLNEALAAYETQLIRAALQQAGGNTSRAAAILQIPRTTLYSRMEALHLRK